MRRTFYVVRVLKITSAALTQESLKSQKLKMISGGEEVKIRFNNLVDLVLLTEFTIMIGYRIFISC